MRKKVARTHSCRNASRMRSVVPGHGPSSKVSTTSLGASGRVWGSCLRPTRGVVVASTARTRAVPSAFALPGQGGAAMAAVLSAAADASARNAAHDPMVRFIVDALDHVGNDCEQTGFELAAAEDER